MVPKPASVLPKIRCLSKWIVRHVGIVGALAFVLAGGSLIGARANDNPSGFPIPRFVSLKSNPVNLRKGPGMEYPKAWIFRRAGLPVEVIQEYGNWRRVRDSEGATGWVFHSLLSGRRTALVLPWETKKGREAAMTPLRRAAQERASVIARVEAGTLLTIKSCASAWCRVGVGDFRGYVKKERLWGVYPNETVR